MGTIYTTLGEMYTVDYWTGDQAPTSFFISMGSGDTTAAKGDTAMSEEFDVRSEAREVGVRSNPASDQVRWVATHTFNTSQGVRETGLHPIGSGGDILIHGDYAVINVQPSDAIQNTITLEFA